VPPGDYLTGTLELKSKVTLHLEAGATLWGSAERTHYRHEALIYAEDARDAALAGRGAIDGNGPLFWRREGKRWQAGSWRPMHMLAFLRCVNLLIEGVTLRNTPCWALHPMDCDRVSIHGISILNGVTEEERGPNQDGIDPDACTGVRISDCLIQSGDDSIVLKIMDRPGGRRVCSDVAVTNCVIEIRRARRTRRAGRRRR
jgi:polygalacturonase